MENSQQSQDPIERLADLVDDSKRAYTETQNELKETEVLLEQTSGEVKKLDQRTTQVTNKLRHIEANLNSYPREDIQEAYSASQASQLRLVMLRSQVEQLQAKKESLENQAERLRGFLDTADQIPGLSTPGENLSIAPMGADSVIMRSIEAQEGERQRLAQLHGCHPQHTQPQDQVNQRKGSPVPETDQKLHVYRTQQREIKTSAPHFAT